MHNRKLVRILHKVQRFQSATSSLHRLWPSSDIITKEHILWQVKSLIKVRLCYQSAFQPPPAINEHNWPERSLVYLCRLFDNLHAGDDYTEISPACHISILDFTLFPEQTEFYASYKLLNEKNHHKYSDKFALHVSDLTQIQIATEEDKAYGLDRWAKLFKATTWEEFKMIAAKDEIMQEAGETVFKLNWTDSEHYLCEAREETRRAWNTINKQLEMTQTSLAEKDATIAELKATIASLKAEQ